MLVALYIECKPLCTCEGRRKPPGASHPHAAPVRTKRVFVDQLLGPQVVTLSSHVSYKGIASSFLLLVTALVTSSFQPHITPNPPGLGATSETLRWLQPRLCLRASHIIHQAGIGGCSRQKEPLWDYSTGGTKSNEIKLRQV